MVLICLLCHYCTDHATSFQLMWIKAICKLVAFPASHHDNAAHCQDVNRCPSAKLVQSQTNPTEEESLTWHQWSELMYKPVLYDWLLLNFKKKARGAAGKCHFPNCINYYHNLWLMWYKRKMLENTFNFLYTQSIAPSKILVWQIHHTESLYLQTSNGVDFQQLHCGTLLLMQQMPGKVLSFSDVG